jgi:hypothetical protein
MFALTIDNVVPRALVAAVNQTINVTHKPARGSGTQCELALVCHRLAFACGVHACALHKISLHGRVRLYAWSETTRGQTDTQQSLANLGSLLRQARGPWPWCVHRARTIRCVVVVPVKRCVSNAIAVLRGEKT